MVFLDFDWHVNAGSFRLVFNIVCGCVNNRLAIGEGREVQRVERPENAVLVEIAAQGENGVQEEIALSCETETEVQTGVPGMPFIDRSAMSQDRFALL